MRRKAAAERARNGLSDRCAVRVDGDLTTSRAEMAGILAALQKVDLSVFAAIGTYSQGVVNNLERFRGRASPPFLENTLYPDLLEQTLQFLQVRTELGSKTIFYILRAHRGLPLNEMAV